MLLLTLVLGCQLSAADSNLKKLVGAVASVFISDSSDSDFKKLSDAGASDSDKKIIAYYNAARYNKYGLEKILSDCVQSWENSSEHRKKQQTTYIDYYKISFDFAYPETVVDRDGMYQSARFGKVNFFNVWYIDRANKLRALCGFPPIVFADEKKPEENIRASIECTEFINQVLAVTKNPYSQFRE